jgi:hypothetical protein
MNDFLLIAGILSALVGGIGVVKPLSVLGEKRAWACALMLIGTIGAFTGATRSDAGGEPGSDHMLLDEFLSHYDHSEIHAIRIHAQPDRIFRAIKEVTIRDLGPANMLTWLRTLPHHVSEDHLGVRYPPRPDRPLLDLDSSEGFTLLTEEPGREMVLGFVGRFWQLSGGKTVHMTGPEDFVEFNRPGFAKAAWNLHVENEGRGWYRLTTETRILGTDAEARRKFTRYWTVIYPGSAFIRRVFLKAVKRKAEEPDVGAHL